MRTTFREEETRYTSWDTAAEQAELTQDEQERAHAQAALEDYLDHVCLPLVERLSYTERLEMRREIAPHLRSLADAFEEMGDPPVTAMRKALEKFGPPEVVARLWKPAVRATPGSRGQQIRQWLRRQWPGMAATLTACSLVATVFAFLRPAPLTGQATTPAQSVTQAESVQVATGLPTSQHSFAIQHMECIACHRSSGAEWRGSLERNLALSQAQRLMDAQVAMEVERARLQSVKAMLQAQKREIVERDQRLLEIQRLQDSMRRNPK